ncbi:MAG: hypothetical protein J2P50_13050 [Hyphomicrobiaceae bacterium]|nr:hypothetical protein [Hyphomicrobiaceae bacterium]
MAAVFAVVGVLLLGLALGALLASPAIDQQTFAMMQVIAGLLCILIAVVAGLMRPSVPVPAAAPRPTAPQPAIAATPPTRVGVGLLVMALAVILIALASWLRDGHERDARALIPMPASGSQPGPAKSTRPAVTPTGGTDLRRSGVKVHPSQRAKPAGDDD